MTPAAQAGSTGSQSNPPTITSDPRGSLTTAERKSSYSLRNRSSLWARGPFPSSGPPLTTNRVGSPPVCESITRTFRLPLPPILSTLGPVFIEARPVSYIFYTEVRRSFYGYNMQSSTSLHPEETRQRRRAMNESAVAQ